MHCYALLCTVMHCYAPIDTKYHDDTLWVPEYSEIDKILKLQEPLEPTDATDQIRRIARHATFSLAYKLHAFEREAERGIIVSDVLYVLKNGYVYDAACEATQHGYYKYQIEGRTPNSDNRNISLVIIPNFTNYAVKLVTIMWECGQMKNPHVPEP